MSYTSLESGECFRDVIMQKALAQTSAQNGLIRQSALYICISAPTVCARTAELCVYIRMCVC